jgi:hypothetical protein
VRADQAGRLRCSMCWRRTGRGAPAGAADRGHGHPERAWPGAAPAAALPQALADLNAAYRNIPASVADRRKGPKAGRPRFRSRKDRRQAIRFTANARFKVLTSGKLRLPKIGDVPVRWSRPPPSEPSEAVQRSGHCWMSSTTWHGQRHHRMNPRTTGRPGLSMHRIFFMRCHNQQNDSPS